MLKNTQKTGLSVQPCFRLSVRQSSCFSLRLLSNSRKNAFIKPKFLYVAYMNPIMFSNENGESIIYSFFTGSFERVLMHYGLWLGFIKNAFWRCYTIFKKRFIVIKWFFIIALSNNVLKFIFGMSFYLSVRLSVFPYVSPLMF